MRILYIVSGWQSDKKFVSANFNNAKKEFLKDRNSYLEVLFEDITTKGNFNSRFEIWKKVGKFGVDEGIWLRDCKNKRKKEKMICESVKDFPEDEFFLKKYLY